jgi:hypothetical protein
MEIEKQKGQEVVNPYILFVFYRTRADLELATKRLSALKSRRRSQDTSCSMSDET